MKSLMSFLVLAALSAPFALANSGEERQFKLPCRKLGDFESDVKTVRESAYVVVKTIYKDRTGQWQSEYSLNFTKRTSGNIRPVTQNFKFEPAGSGDEDYDEYNLVDPKEETGIQGASIQNRFRWASLIDTNGTGALRCSAKE